MVWWRILAYAVGYFVHDASPVILTVWAETTRGVYQASGYGDVNADKSIWFVLKFGWFICFLICVLPPGSGSSPRAQILILPPSSRGSTVV